MVSAHTLTLGGRCPLLSLHLLLHLASWQQAAIGDDECWIGSFTEETCCAGPDGVGNVACWDGELFTFERCCSVGSASNAASEELSSQETPSDQEGTGGFVLFDDNLPSMAFGIREALAEHARLDAQGLTDCLLDGTVAQADLAEARSEVARALSQASVPGQTSQPAGNGLSINKFYRDPGSLLQRCPQAVLQASASNLERILANLANACSDLSAVRMCQHNTAFMLDSFVYHVVLRHALIELYSSTGQSSQLRNLTNAEVFRGWPVEEHERRVWHFFTLLWRTVWEQRDFCSCVEGYDYYATLHALLEQTLRLSSDNFAKRALRPGSLLHRMGDAADHCDDWLDKDFNRIFSSYAKLSACIPGAIMENIVCMHRWMLKGQVVGAVNTAELMVKLMTLAGSCLEDTKWPFTREDVQHNFAMIALHWQEADVECTARNRFGDVVTQGDCPQRLAEETLQKLFWKRSPLQRSELAEDTDSCVADLDGACIIKGVIHAQGVSSLSSARFTHAISLREVEKDKWALVTEPALESCSETGRNRHVVRMSSAEKLQDIAVGSSKDDGHGRSIGFALNVPIFADNIWHNVHWLVPAVARLHGEESLRRAVPDDIDLVLVLAGAALT